MVKYPVVTLKIPEDWIPWAKEKTKEFDEVKGWDKFECDTNWIGILGERLFAEFLRSQGVGHKWHGELDFNQGNFTTPDFTIYTEEDFTLDVKTASHGRDLMFPKEQKPYFDYFVFITLNQEQTEAYIQGYISRKNAVRYKKIVGKSRCVPMQKMKPIWGLVGGWD